MALNPQKIEILYSLSRTSIYIASYSDLIEAVQPLTDYTDKLEFAGQHYVLFGRSESENRAREIFNPTSYLANNLDVAADPFYSTEPTRHYIEYGYSEGRSV